MTDAIIEAAALALKDASNDVIVWPDYCDLAAAILAAVTPLIRAAALEEAAQMIENYTKGGADVRLVIGDMRALARSLKEQP